MNTAVAIQVLEKALKNAALILQNGGEARRFRVGICIINVANAQVIRKTNGEQTAILLFQEFFERAAKIARTRDEIVQLNETQMAVIFKGETSEQELHRAADKLTALFVNPITILAEQIKAEVGFGLAVSEGADIGAQTLFENALEELESTHPSEDATDIDWTIKTNLEEAVNTGEFVCYYQPRIAPAFEHITGATAHLRWHTSQQHILTPDQFLEIADQTGLLEPIIHGMIKTSLSQASRWQGDLNIVMTVPLGLFSDDAILVLFKDLLAIFDLPKERVILSLGDVELSNDDYQLSAAADIINQAQAMGLRISGYVQPGVQLTAIVLDEYQVDASGLRRSEPHLTNLLEQAKSSDAKLVVNKVTKQREVDWFREAGVDALQGDFYSPAIPQPEFREWLTRKTGK